MKKVLVLGAGRSSSSLIKYLLKAAAENDYEITVADTSIESVLQKTKKSSRSRPVLLDTHDESKTRAEIERADLVISMLPAFLHSAIAVQCVKFKKNLITASYVSPEMRNLNDGAKKAGIILMNEAGLDPGIDHASAVRIIERIKSAGGKLLAYKSYTGGLIAPESDDNPWGYKFTWNPRNVILAGQETVKYMENGRYAFIPYQKLFTRTENIHFEGLGDFEGYANRDSLSYRSVYGLEDIPTILRGTLRKKGFCEAWNIFVQLGMTDNSYMVPESEKLSICELVESFLPQGKTDVRTRLCQYLEIPLKGDIMSKLEWLGLFGDTRLKMKNASPALLLQAFLESKWKLKEGDIDMIIMQHQFEYELQGKKQKLFSSLVVKGEDAIYTAMAKTVGLPVGIITKLILQGKIKLTGVQTPTVKEIYLPLLDELETLGIRFKEREE